MLDKLEAIKARFEDLGVALTNPAIIGDNKKFGQLSQEYRSLEKIVNAYAIVLKNIETSFRKNIVRLYHTFSDLQAHLHTARHYHLPPAIVHNSSYQTNCVPI